LALALTLDKDDLSASRSGCFTPGEITLEKKCNLKGYITKQQETLALDKDELSASRSGRFTPGEITLERKCNLKEYLTEEQEALCMLNTCSVIHGQQ
jgi:hypothetical protein